ARFSLRRSDARGTGRGAMVDERHDALEGDGEITLDLAHRWPVHWTSRLKRLTAKLASNMDAARTAQAAVEQGREALGADGGVVFLLAPNRQELQALHAEGYPPSATESWRRFPLSVAVPATDAVRRCQGVVVHSKAELAAMYPGLECPDGL